MISLVLQCPRKKFGAFDRDRFTMDIETFSDSSKGARGWIDQLGKTQTALISLLHLFTQIKGWVDQMSKCFIDIPDKNSKWNTDLRGRKTCARSIKHRLGQIFDQHSQLLIEVNNFRCRCHKDRVSEVANWLDGHVHILLSRERIRIYANRGERLLRRTSPALKLMKKRDEFFAII